MFVGEILLYCYDTIIVVSDRFLPPREGEGRVCYLLKCKVCPMRSFLVRR